MLSSVDTFADDSEGFLVRTCHNLSVQLKVSELLLDKESKEIIISGAAYGPVKVILAEYCEAGFDVTIMADIC